MKCIPALRMACSRLMPTDRRCPVIGSRSALALGTVRGMLKTSTRMAPGVRGALFAMVPLAVPSASFAADELLPIEQRGQAVLAEFCGSCHAIGRTEESPNPAAPPFRTIDRRFPIETLRQKMEEGLIMSGHPDMPTFRFRREDIRPVIAYLLAIQKD